MGEGRVQWPYPDNSDNFSKLAFLGKKHGSEIRRGWEMREIIFEFTFVSFLISNFRVFDCLTPSPPPHRASVFRRDDLSTDCI